MATTFDTKLRSALGDKSAKALAGAFGYETVGDLLRHHPRRYINIAHPESLADLDVGQNVTMLLEVHDVKTFPFRNQPRKVRTQVTFTDGSSWLDAVFFNQRWLSKALRVGSLQLVTGMVGEYGGRPQLTHPALQEVPEGLTLAQLRQDRPLIPVYPASQKIASWKIEDAIGLLLDVVDQWPEPLPTSVREERQLLGAEAAFRALHEPATDSDWRRARERFIFEEAFVLQSVFARRRQTFDLSTATARPEISGGLRERFISRLPFQLTAGQHEVAAEIAADLARPHPMHRLLQGEVGSGKTIVALLAMLQTVDAGAQAALLAPTEVLAMQHHRSITAMLGDLAQQGMLGGADGATRVRLLTGSMPAKARNESLLDITSGAAGIVVGTHALIQESVQFAELGLLVVDEQHRFGVEQRAALVDRARVTPHVLVMTATPIPRTVAMTVFGDLETSTLRELPRGRQSIQTNVVPVLEKPAWLERAWGRIREEVERGRQAYVVATRIGDDAVSAPGGTTGEDSPTTSVTELFEMLSAGPLAGLRVAILHGRLAADEKDAVMSSFSAGDIDVLVATTVIEVGVDVPNATVMVIADADRFGLSQLHQLRGRVGRGSEPGLCLLVTTSEVDSVARERLNAVAGTADGFELARLDVELRREGDVLGHRQSGLRSSLRLLRVVRDEEVINEARGVARRVVAEDLATADLDAAIAYLEDTERADFLERT